MLAVALAAGGAVLGTAAGAEESPAGLSDPGGVRSVTRIPGSDELWALQRNRNSSAFATYTPGDGWTRVHEFPHVAITDFVMVSATEGWAIGEKVSQWYRVAALYHWDGESWQRKTLPTGIKRYSDITAITRSPGSNKVWIASSTDEYGDVPITRVTSWDGDKWRMQSLGTHEYTRDIRAVGENDVWLSVGGWGEESELLHYDGTDWTPTDPGFDEEDAAITAIGAAGPEDIWVSGPDLPAGLATSNWDGSRWAWHDLPDGFDRETATPVDSTRSSTAWLATGDGKVVRWNGTSWRTVDVSSACSAEVKSFKAIDAVGNDDIYLAGGCDGESFVAHYDGQDWTRI